MKKEKKINIRIFVQIFFFTLIALISVNKTLEEAGVAIPFLSDASLHTLCPFGGVVTLYNLATLGTFIQKIHISAIILFVIILLISVLLGPVFCGWVCPFGSIQEWIGKIGRKIFKAKYNHLIPKKLDYMLRYFRFFVLLWVLFVTARSGYLLFSHVDPYHALFTFWTDEVEIPSLIVLGAVLVLSVFVERPWCKYTCPYGALLGLTNKIRIFKIRRKQSTCIGCRKCDIGCPMNIEVSQKEKITNNQCISCYECTSERNCPIPDTVNMELLNQRHDTLKQQSN